MVKEEFKRLRAEAGFETDTSFARALGISVLNINAWNIKQSPYPKYLRNILFLFKMNKEFDKEKYEEFLLNLMPKCKQKIPREYKFLLKRVKLALEDKSFEDLEKENVKLKAQLEFLNGLALEL